jgi:hypothetical protein
MGNDSLEESKSCRVHAPESDERQAPHAAVGIGSQDAGKCCHCDVWPLDLSPVWSVTANKTLAGAEESFALNGIAAHLGDRIAQCDREKMPTLADGNA